MAKEILGYARGSTKEQKLERQIIELIYRLGRDKEAIGAGEYSTPASRGNCSLA